MSLSTARGSEEESKEPEQGRSGKSGPAGDKDASRKDGGQPKGEQKEEKDDPVGRGRQAVAAGKALKPGSPEQKDKDEAEDAEKWRNEG